MDLKKIIKASRKLSRPYRVTGKGKFRLSAFDPADTGKLDQEDKPRAKKALHTGIQALAAMQDMLYAQDRWSLLLVFQAMDAAGKDGAIKHVMSGINPQGCQVVSFKAPSNEELDHDFLWRCNRKLPERGRIGIFNRSYYEEVLVLRVHPFLLENQKLPQQRRGKNLWQDRYRDIRAYERYLDANGTKVLKFFLNLSRDEQKRRFLERIDNPEKNWKFSAADARERGYWDDYMKNYEAAIGHTATAESPWFVVPADNKWYTRVVVAAAIIEAMASLGLHYPEVGNAKRKELALVRKTLLAEDA
ncbi:MAG TPA: polyphosphate kinase 2 family protein [Xanthomonadales bacterium]|nr:polyphosphate kinase 2 family protein [Xanthomonadales bacterium]